jgi:hypothetical protein
MNHLIKQISIKVPGKRYYSHPKKNQWISSDPGFLYIYWSKCRMYWVLPNMIRHGMKLPKISFNDIMQVMRISSYYLKFEKNKDYERVKYNLQKWPNRRKPNPFT